jgi:hypothetical protein
MNPSKIQRDKYMWAKRGDNLRNHKNETICKKQGNEQSVMDECEKWSLIYCRSVSAKFRLRYYQFLPWVISFLSKKPPSGRHQSSCSTGLMADGQKTTLIPSGAENRNLSHYNWWMSGLSRHPKRMEERGPERWKSARKISLPSTIMKPREVTVTATVTVTVTVTDTVLHISLYEMPLYLYTPIAKYERRNLRCRYEGTVI